MLNDEWERSVEWGVVLNVELPVAMAYAYFNIQHSKIKFFYFLLSADS